MVNFNSGDMVNPRPGTKLDHKSKTHGKDWIIINSPKPLLCFDNDFGVLVESVLTGNRRNAKLTEIVKIA